jgi:hypothetical protein
MQNTARKNWHVVQQKDLSLKNAVLIRKQRTTESFTQLRHKLFANYHLKKFTQRLHN